MDVASGVPREALLAKYEISYQALAKVLEKPRVAGMVDGHRASIGDAMVRLNHRMAIQSDGILQGIIDSAVDDGCPHRFHNARYVIDKLLPNVSYVATDNHYTVDVEVMGAFNDGAKELEKFVGKGGVQEGFALEEDDPHLHIGKEFIDKRDKNLAGIGEHLEDG